MGQLRIQELSIEQFVSLLNEKRGFSFARYGDGTFLCLNGRSGQNCDGASLDIRQAEGLEASIRDRTISHAIGDLALTTGMAEQWLKEKQIDIDWYECNVMNTASHQGRLWPFVRWLQERESILIAPSHLKRLKGFPVSQFVEVHPTKAWEKLEETVQEASHYAFSRGVNTVLISAGPSAPTLVSRIHCYLPYANVIDTGSIWDPYVGVLSRKIHRRMGRRKISELGRLNFHMETDGWWKT